jgi:hypothetical protein
MPIVASYPQYAILNDRQALGDLENGGRRRGRAELELTGAAATNRRRVFMLFSLARR